MQIDFIKATELIANGDVAGLREMLEDVKVGGEYVPYGYAVRAIVARIALLPRMPEDLAELALELALPWIDMVDLCAMVGLAVPSSGILRSEPRLKDVYLLEDFYLPGAKDEIDGMDDVQLCAFMAQVYNDPEEGTAIHPDVIEAVARRVYDLSMQSDLNYFFGTGQKALFAYASMIPDADVGTDTEAAGGWLPEEPCSGGVKPPYAGD